jgi:hypothetical protein
MSEADFLVKVRDGATMIADACQERLEKLSPKEAGPTVAVKEQTFSTLKFEEQQGAKIGSYQVAYEKTNIPEKFSVALNILTKSNALINARYYGEGYEFAYWTYQGKIYRQKLKKQA